MRLTHPDEAILVPGSIFGGLLGTARALDVILDTAQRMKHEQSVRF